MFITLLTIYLTAAVTIFTLALMLYLANNTFSFLYPGTKSKFETMVSSRLLLTFWAWPIWVIYLLAKGAKIAWEKSGWGNTVPPTNTRNGLNELSVKTPKDSKEDPTEILGANKAYAPGRSKE